MFRLFPAGVGNTSKLQTLVGTSLLRQKQQKYGQWLAEEGINQLTPAGNLKAPPRRTIVKWILEAWSEISPEIIRRSFKVCALNLATDGSEDTLIVLKKISHVKLEKNFWKTKCQS